MGSGTFWSVAAVVYDIGKVYSMVGSALSIFPAVGPIVGGLITQNLGWRAIFLFLILFASLLLIILVFLLPETHHAENRTAISIKEVALRLIKDKKVLGFAFIVGGCNGISFSYFAEGPFYMIKILGLTASQYGLTFVPLASAALFGGILSKSLHQTHSALAIMRYGLNIILTATSLLVY